MTYMLNRWSGIGNATVDPQYGYTQSGIRWATFRIACDRPFQSNDGLDADFIPVVTKGDLAENMIKYLEKGRLIYVEGRLSVRPYDGDGVERWMLEVEADHIRMLDDPSKHTRRDEQRNMAPVSNSGRGRGRYDRSTGDGSRRVYPGTAPSTHERIVGSPARERRVGPANPRR